MSITSPRVIFFGTPEFAAYILEHLVNSGVNVVAVVTTPEKEQGRGLKTRPAALQTKALDLGLPVLTPGKNRDPQFVEALRTYDADIFCVVAYKILPPEVFTMPRLGTFNVHTSLLPKYRGAAPMQWALMNGETETGVTTFLLDSKIDTGGILLQEKVSITENETLGELHDELMHLGATIALSTIAGLAAGSLIPKPQDNTAASPAPKILPEHCIIRFDRPVEQVHNQIRGLSPFPGAVMTIDDGERLKLFRTSIDRGGRSIVPSALARDATNKRLFVGTASLPLEVLEVQREGRRRMSAEEFLRGTRIEIPLMAE
jgi:methionyl-tRNA formyltransferase